MKSGHLAVVALLVASQISFAQDVPSDVTFTLKRAWLEQLLTEGSGGRSVGARWSAHLKMGQHSGVHAVAADCELHAAGKLAGNLTLGSPAGIVVEPPNVCKKRVPQLPAGGQLGARWTKYFDDHVTGADCEVAGFPRIFSEHAQGGEANSSNPDHVVEIHPATSISCGGTTMDFLPLLTVVPGMKRITDNSAIACLEDRKLYVRMRGGTAQARYEFLEEGAKGGNGRCGNFIVVDAHVSKDYIRALSNGSDHVALARVWIGESGPFPLKIYTYAGTPEDAAVAALLASADENESLEMSLHGLLTYDYFTIAQTLQEDDGSGGFRWKSAMKDYVEVSHPLALVVFGQASP
jgi:hypothetical protein